MWSLCFFIAILAASTRLASSLWLPFSSPSPAASRGGPVLPERRDERAEFSVHSFESQEGRKLLEEARAKQLSLNSCWEEAYRNLFASCAEILSNEEKHKRLAWHLSDCFVRDSGSSSLPACGTRSAMKDCRKKLQDFENNIYLQFFIQTNAICHQLQANAFKRDTEMLINGLKSSAHIAEEKLEGLERKTGELLQSSAQVQDSLAAVDARTQDIAKRSGDFETQMDNLMKHSEVIFEHTKGIAASQSELQEGQSSMKEKLEAGMSLVHKSYESLSDGMEVLKKETSEIEKEINQVGSLMSRKMENLQSTADDIGQIAGVSLDKQKQLLNGQVKALEELDFLSRFQSQALEESRQTLHELGELRREQQEELLQQKKQIEQSHERLIENSRSILAAQEMFEAKQANIFAALDKLFTLHNAILTESRFIKSIFFYCIVIFLCYILTSAKQTFSVRAYLYLGIIFTIDTAFAKVYIQFSPTLSWLIFVGSSGICSTFLVEVAILRFTEDDYHPESSVTSKVFLARSTFLVVSSLQILYAIFTYRDYEVLNHRMLKELREKIDGIESRKGELPALSMGSDTDIDDWIDRDLPEEVNSYDDPDYAVAEEVAENSIMLSNSRSYNLRPRGRRWREEN